MATPTLPDWAPDDPRWIDTIVEHCPPPTSELIEDLRKVWAPILAALDIESAEPERRAA